MHAQIRLFITVNFRLLFRGRLRTSLRTLQIRCKVRNQFTSWFVIGWGFLVANYRFCLQTWGQLYKKAIKINYD